MRLIRNQSVADSIVEYDAMVRRGLVLQDLINTQYIPRLIDKRNYALNITELDKLQGSERTNTDTNILKEKMLLIHDKTEMIRLVNELRHYRYVIMLQLQFITDDRTLAIKLCERLKKAYHLE